MKTWLLLRHGKSDWTSNVADHDRVLAPRGEDAADGQTVADVGIRHERTTHRDGQLAGVLDVDSPSLDRFSESDRVGIELLCETYSRLQSGRGAI